MRSRFYYRPGHPAANDRGFVDAGDLGVEPAQHRALDAPIMMDRFYENTAATDGTDIGSRRKHREYMKQNNLTTVDDYKETWARKAAERERVDKGDWDHKARREAVGRAIYDLERKKR